MNKKELRKYADPGLSFSPGNGLLCTVQIKHLVRSAVKNIAGRRTLVLYFYDREKAAEGCAVPEYTLFQYRDDYITLQRTAEGELKWRSARLDSLGERYAYFTKTCAFYRQGDGRRVIRFCNIPEKTGFDALNALQEAIMAKRLAGRIRERETKTVERMKTVPPVPRGLKGWIHREVLPQYIFYDYVRGGKPMGGYCTACKHGVTVSGARHNGKGKCPRCGKAVTFKASGKAKRVRDRATVQVLQKAGDGLMLRIFKVCNGLRDWRRPDLSVWENARFFIRQSDEKTMETEAYYYAYGSGTLTDWKKGYRPHFMRYRYSFECDTCGHLFCGNLDGALCGTPWRYSQLGRFCQISREPLEVLPYLGAYHRIPAIEYLVKLGLTRLAAQVVYEHGGAKAVNADGKDLRETLGVEPEDLPVLQKINVNIRQLELCRELRRQGFRADETLLTWYRERGIYSKEDVLIPLLYMTPLKLMRYADGQYERLKDWKNRYNVRRYERPGSILSEYKDYLEMGGKLGYDFADSFILFPKNLPEAHDRASQLYDTRKKAALDKAIREAYKALRDRYRFSKDGFTVIPPKTAEEIVAEGHTLHHCVHTYVERVAQRRCVVLFIRRKDKIKEPFYTVELQDGRVIQIHGMRHCAPASEVKEFIELWERKKLRAADISEAA